MSKRQFFHSTPNDIDLFITQHDEERRDVLKAEAEKIQYTAWLNGAYIRLAVASVLSKKSKYPKKPPGEQEQVQHIEVTEDMSEEEKNDALEKLTKNLEELFINPMAADESE